MKATPRLELGRSAILAHRRRVGHLEQRLPRGARSLRLAGWAGFQDSMPRAAVLSISARVESTHHSIWEDRSLVQLWGPRYNTYVVTGRDLALFTLGRLPDDEKRRALAYHLADRLDSLLGGRAMLQGEAGRALGVHPNQLRYAAPTGRVLIRWDGARQPTVWTVPAPDMTPLQARLELARRHLHVFGPATPESFARWAGIKPYRGAETFTALRRSLTPVGTPIGEAWILSRDEASFRAEPNCAAPARLLPSGDTYFLLQDDDRRLLVPEAANRKALWPSRVWPGAVLVEGEIVGTWRRALDKLTIEPWSRLSRSARVAVEAEATALPIPGALEIAVRWAA